MANIFNAVIRVEHPKMTGKMCDDIFNELKNEVAYDDYCEWYDEWYEGQDFFAVSMPLKWSLNYVQDTLCEIAKKFKCRLRCRGEEEGVGFYEVMLVTNKGKIKVNECLSFV